MLARSNALPQDSPIVGGARSAAAEDRSVRVNAKYVHIFAHWGESADYNASLSENMYTFGETATQCACETCGPLGTEALPAGVRRAGLACPPCPISAARGTLLRARGARGSRGTGTLPAGVLNTQVAAKKGASLQDAP